MPEKITGKIADKAANKISEVVRAGVKTSLLGSILLLASCSSEPEVDMTRCMKPSEHYQKYMAYTLKEHEAVAVVETSYRYKNKPDGRHAIFAVRMPELERPLLLIANNYDRPTGGGGFMRLIDILTKTMVIIIPLQPIQ